MPYLCLRPNRMKTARLFCVLKMCAVLIHSMTPALRASNPMRNGTFGIWLWAILSLPFWAGSCASAAHTKSNPSPLASDIEQSSVFSNGFTGFVLFDPEKNQTLCAINGDRYFTPASNTKILTLYLSSRLLGDSLLAFRYRYAHDGALEIKPTGDPTFLHPKFRHWQAGYALLRQAIGDHFYVCDLPKFPIPYGPGWNWDDFDYDYSAERSSLPMYGNLRRLFALRRDSLSVEPAYWRPYLYKKQDPKGDVHVSDPQNSIAYPKEKQFPQDYERWVPVHGVREQMESLLADTLWKRVRNSDPLRYGTQQPWKNFRSCPVDTVYRLLMHHSDNFIAEQLLLQCAAIKFDTLDEQKIIRWANDSLFASLPAKPRWVDGSGLSRYNLNTPSNIVWVLHQLWKAQNHQRLMDWFPSGGVSGTIQTWYANKKGEPPYVFAKTGTMGGVHCLSGYLRTDSGKTLIFSFMHNNFVVPSKTYKEEMQRILETIKKRM